MIPSVAPATPAACERRYQITEQVSICSVPFNLLFVEADMRVIVCGGREFEDYDLVKTVLAAFRNLWGDFTVVSGAAHGADSLGERWARESELLVQRFPAQWDRHGKRAGYIRNQQMLDTLATGDAVVAFWNGASRGTQMMIELGRARRDVQVYVSRY